MQAYRVLTLILIRIIGVISDQLSIAGSLMVLFSHKDDTILTWLRKKQHWLYKHYE